MIGRITDADMAIVNVLARENHLFTVKAGNDDAFPVLDGKERVVFAVDEADHTLILVRVWKGGNAHDVYRLTVTHRDSPLSFFGVVRFCSCCAVRFCCFLYSFPARSQKSSMQEERSER